MGHRGLPREPGPRHASRCSGPLCTARPTALPPAPKGLPFGVSPAVPDGNRRGHGVHLFFKVHVLLYLKEGALTPVQKETMYTNFIFVMFLSLRKLLFYFLKNVVLVSAVQEREPATVTYTPPSSLPRVPLPRVPLPHPFRSSQSPRLAPPCYSATSQRLASLHLRVCLC